jgi:hypothetical protein
VGVECGEQGFDFETKIGIVSTRLVEIGGAEIRIELDGLVENPLQGGISFM